MRSSKFWFFIILILAMAAVLIAMFIRNKDAPSADISKPKYKEIEVTRGTIQIVVSASGVVQPIDRIEIKSKASGQIVDLPVEEGDFVKKNQLITRLDQKDEKSAVAQAQADLDIATAELKQAQRTYERRVELFSKNFISEEERDQSELSLAIAKGKLVQATTALETANERLADSVVRAPTDGVILQKYVEEGQIIASGVSNVSGGTPIVDIADMTSVYIEAGVDEIDIGKITIDQEASVTADAYPQMQFRGKIVRIAPEAKIEQNVTLFDVIVEVENTDGKLKSGMNTNIEITIRKRDDVLLIPVMALQASGESKSGPEQNTVLVKQGTGYRSRPVTLGLSNFKQVEITSGLNEGDILGVPMTSRLKDENDELQMRIRSSRSFGKNNRQSNR